MDLKEQISQDYMVAFRKNDPAKIFLSVLKGEIQNESTKKGGATPLEVVLRMEKSLKQVNNSESLQELEVLKKYIPSPLTEDEIKEIIKEYKSQGLDNMGKMMGEFNKNFKGRADNKMVNVIITEILKNS